MATFDPIFPPLWVTPVSEHENLDINVIDPGQYFNLLTQPNNIYLTNSLFQFTNSLGAILGRLSSATSVDAGFVNQHMVEIRKSLATLAAIQGLLHWSLLNSGVGGGSINIRQLNEVDVYERLMQNFNTQNVVSQPYP